MQLDKARTGELSLLQLQAMGVAVKRKSTSLERRQRNYKSYAAMQEALSDVQREQMRTSTLRRLFGATEDAVPADNDASASSLGSGNVPTGINNSSNAHVGCSQLQPSLENDASVNRSTTDGDILLSAVDTGASVSHPARVRVDAHETIPPPPPKTDAIHKIHQHNDTSTYAVDSKNLMRRKSVYIEPSPGDEQFSDFDFNIDEI